MDIATLVKHVISAFEDASSLIKRIQQKRAGEDKALPEEPCNDLLDSLALGPVIVRGHYGHDLKRFGEPYACGDIQAREQMKDVLIQLQMAMITDLRTVWMDDLDIDFSALQTVSDDCRVNAGVCLGQLSQRLSDVAKAQAMYPANMTPYAANGMLMPPMSPSLQYSSSRSTASSTFSRPLPPRTPDSLGDHMSSISIASTVRPSHYEQKGSIGGSSHGSQSPHTNWGSPRLDVPPVPQIPLQYPSRPQHDPDTQSLHSMRRPSSHTLAPEDVQLLSPMMYQGEKDGSQPGSSPPLPGAQDLDRDSYVSYGADSQPATSPQVSRAPSAHLTSPTHVVGHDQQRDQPSQPRLNTTGDDLRYQTVYELQPTSEEPRQSRTSFSSRTQAATYNTPEHVFYLQQNARAPASDVSTRSPWPAHVQVPYAPPERSQLRPPSSEQEIESQAGSRTMVVEPQMQPQYTYQQPSIPPPILQPVRSVPQPAFPSEPPIPQTSGLVPMVSDRQNWQPDPLNRSFPTRPPIPSAPMPAPPFLRTNTVSTTNSSNQSLPMQLPSPPPQPLYATPTTASNRIATTTHNDIPRQLQPPPPPLVNITPLTPPPLAPTGPLILPTDKQTLGFCKGAARLQIGLDKKAVSLSTRPAGLTGSIQFWKCRECNFEGPLHTSIPVAAPGSKKSKPEKTFDPKIRVSTPENGIRYRWAFLAKCHVYCRILPDGYRDGSFGSFQCVFCVAEAERRGWSSTTSKLTGTDGASTFSGSSGKTGGAGGAGGAGAVGPVFGNVGAFMDHLGVHRRNGWWPCEEVCRRFKVVVGRVAELGEEFEVNFTPV